eukprot:5288749-Amphidinium_carterae.1
MLSTLRSSMDANMRPERTSVLAVAREGSLKDSAGTTRAFSTEVVGYSTACSSKPCNRIHFQGREH